MTVVHLSTHDLRGGAARAAYRLHEGQLLAGIDSRMVVQESQSTRASIYAPESSALRGWAKLRPHLEDLPLKCYRSRRDLPFSIQWLPDRLNTAVHSLEPDLIHLHWICGGFLQIETIASFDSPIVWTLHDMWPMTGGCHYSGSCDGYQSRCGQCPQLGSQSLVDLSRLTWLRKRMSWTNLDMTIVTPSRWLAKCVQSSSLLESFRTEVIPYGLDLDVYRPIDTEQARNLLNLPQNITLVLFGAVNSTSNPRKGFDLLLRALNRLEVKQSTKTVELAIFGASSPEEGSELPLPTHYLGSFSDDVALRLLYSAADVFVAPSREDNLPLTVQESLACGTPVVAFDIGGMEDMIEHEMNGYLAKSFDAEDLAHGISWCISGNDRRVQLSAEARRVAEEQFSSERQAKAYMELYREIL